MIKRSLKDMLSEFDQIIIPDVQRDYVMGSGGEKFVKLLKAMAESAKKDPEFNFSCLVGYEENKCFYVYDGQQRLTTLVCLCSYLLKGPDTEVKELLRKFSFTGREVANSWLDNPTKIKKEHAVDFTTYSLAKLIEEFDPQYKLSDKISFDFLFEQVVFDLVPVDKLEDAEQFFLDINDGLDLKSYEIFKAELYHHAGILLGEDTFKTFALKMENKWLEFFTAYKHLENKTDDGISKTVVVHCEEEMLIFFMQYCLRMMWIEEKHSDNAYKSTDVRWLKQEHFQRLEAILDAMMREMENVYPDYLSCIRYSLTQYNKYPSDYCKGQHWNIGDTNYLAMLNIFFHNNYKTDETKKDVVIWCYLSNLPFVEERQDLNKKNLYEYLRTVKKILNNNRESCRAARALWCGDGIKDKQIVYARYYVQGIPQYYTGCTNEQCNEVLCFLNDIVVLNKRFEASVSTWLSNNDIQKCKSDLCKNVVMKEFAKQYSPDKETIEQYENLSFINGLADNFLTYDGETCYLKEFCTAAFHTEISTICLDNKPHQYIDILKFIFINRINIGKISFTDIAVSWQNYQGDRGATHRCYGAILLPHAWCDFFTSEMGMPISENALEYPLHSLPDGWISANRRIVQPKDTDVYGMRGFAAHAETHAVWDIRDFLANYDWILSDTDGKFIVNGVQTDSLPVYLNDYNGENFIFDNLSHNIKIYFSAEQHLNNVLLYRFKAFNESSEKERINNFDAYLKEKEGYISIRNMYGSRFFIKLNEMK
ncbi:DUF262 domain-containing protein [Paenibacillus sp. FSL E2-0178]|uniref:DUF262 domain-containing protein n=1 Tax=Paenibacillus sp. FSL E2-0178 TaxID=2921361 RepID=UPI003158C566